MITSLSAPEATRTTVFDPIRPDYADFSVEVRDSFNWSLILNHLKIPTSKFIVLYAFRSITRADADADILAALDEKALLAAEEAVGFLHYEPLINLSYCNWETPDDAKAATSTVEHREAARYAAKAYEKWELRSWYIGKSAVGSPVEFVEF